ncbi:MAG: hypothetical protein LBD53_00505 [Tannerella sp.]|jgi:hypothetical protein|nr:hypothetical protein [Tannerella sp.]
MGLLDLFRPAWKHSDMEIRMLAVKKLTDQKILKKVALKDSFDSVRLAAVKKITDEAVLKDVAFNDEYSYIRQAAVDKLTAQNIIIDIYRKSTPLSYERHRVIDLIDISAHQDIFADYALKCPVEIYYETAEQAKLGWARKRFDSDKIVRIIEQLTDIDSIVKISEHADCNAVRSAAANQLHKKNNL